MKIMEVIRIETPDAPIEDQTKATISVVKLDGKFLCFMLEPPNRNNGKDSCIPEGEYTCKPYSSAKYKSVWEVQKVPKRTYILIHSGNTDKDSLGCLIPGTSVGYLGTKRAVLNSKKALKIIRSKIGINNPFRLIIKKV